MSSTDMTIESKPNMASIPAGDEPQAYVFGPDSILLDYTGTYVLIDGCATARSFVKNVNKVSEAILSNVNEASLGCVFEQTDKDVITYSALPNLKEAGLDGSAQNLAYQIQKKANENAETKLRFNPKYEPVLIDKRGHSSVKIHVLDGARKESLDALDKALTTGTETDLHRVSNQHGLIFVLVWSAKFNEPVKRVLYSGNAPYDRIIQALEKATSLNVIAREVVTPASMVEAPIASGVSKVRTMGSNATLFSLKDKIEAQKKASAATAARTNTRTAAVPSSRSSAPAASTKAAPTRTTTSTLGSSRPSSTLSSTSRPSSKTTTPSSAANPTSRLAARSTLPSSRSSTTTKPTSTATTTSTNTSRTAPKKSGPPSTASTTTKTSTSRVPPSTATVPGKFTRATAAPKASHPPSKSNAAAPRSGAGQARATPSTDTKSVVNPSKGSLGFGGSQMPVEDSILFVGEYITIEDSIQETRTVLSVKNEKGENRISTNTESKNSKRGTLTQTDCDEENILSTKYAMEKEVSENVSLLADEQAVSNQVNLVAPQAESSEVPSLNSFETNANVAEGTTPEIENIQEALEATVIEQETSLITISSDESFVDGKNSDNLTYNKVITDDSTLVEGLLQSVESTEASETFVSEKKESDVVQEEIRSADESTNVVSSTENGPLIDSTEAPEKKVEEIREETVDSTSSFGNYNNRFDISDIRSTSLFNDTLGVNSFADPHNEAIVADSTINTATLLAPQIPDADGLLDHIEEVSKRSIISMDTADDTTEQFDKLVIEGEAMKVDEKLLDELSRETVKEAIEKAQDSLASILAGSSNEDLVNTSIAVDETEKEPIISNHSAENEEENKDVVAGETLSVEEQTRKISQHLIDSAPTEIATALANSMMEGMQNAASQLANEETSPSSEIESVSNSAEEVKQDTSGVDKMLPMQSRSSVVVAESDEHPVVYEKPDPIIGDILETVAADSERIDNDSLKSSDANLIDAYDATNVVRQYWTVTNRGNGPHLKKERYFELATVPHNGAKCSLKNLDEACNYFHSIRSKNYILASEDLPMYVLEGWLEAKKGWGNPDMATSLILTVSSTCLTTFTESHAAELAAQHMSIPAPITNSHITVQYETGQERFNIIRLKL